MRLIYLVITIVTVILIVVGSDRFFRAEAVEHHGYNTDPRGDRKDCLSCHNDKTARSHSKCMPICLFGESHPDNRVYPPPNRIKEFKPASVAQQYGVLFVDGKMDCISCHSLHDKSRYHLRIKNWEKQICYACHIR
jgi:predicted CXXCH cytochrome family protein